MQEIDHVILFLPVIFIVSCRQINTAFLYYWLPLDCFPARLFTADLLIGHQLARAVNVVPDRVRTFDDSTSESLGGGFFIFVRHRSYSNIIHEFSSSSFFL